VVYRRFSIKVERLDRQKPNERRIKWKSDQFYSTTVTLQQFNSGGFSTTNARSAPDRTSQSARRFMVEMMRRFKAVIDPPAVKRVHGPTHMLAGWPDVWGRHGRGHVATGRPSFGPSHIAGPRRPASDRPNERIL